MSMSNRIIRCPSLRRVIDPGKILTAYDLPKQYLIKYGEWIHEISIRMRHAEFDVNISDQQCEPEYYATVDTDFSYRRITIYLCLGFHMLSPQKQRAVIVHELTHPHFKTYSVPYESLSNVVSPDVWTVTAETAMKMEENEVTIFEKIISPNMPLPPLLKGVKCK